MALFGLMPIFAVVAQMRKNRENPLTNADKLCIIKITYINNVLRRAHCLVFVICRSKERYPLSLYSSGMFNPGRSDRLPAEVSGCESARAWCRRIRLVYENVLYERNYGSQSIKNQKEVKMRE